MPRVAQDVVLRDAGPADAGPVAAIWNPIVRDTVITFWPSPRSEADIAAMIAERQAAGQAFLVAEVQGRVAGFASYAQFRAGAGYAHSMEHTIHAAPEARGRGFGRLLLRAIEDHARDRHHRLLIGAITGSNAASLRFHSAMGYAEWGRIPAAGWKFGEFHDLLLMGKDLKKGQPQP